MEEPQNIKIIVVGQTGAGKSTLCNSIVGHNFSRAGDDYQPITTECKRDCFKWSQDSSHMKVTVCDTVGLNDGDFSETKRDELSNFLSEAHLMLYCIESSLELNKLSHDKANIVWLSSIIPKIIIVLTKSDTTLLEEEDLPPDRIEDAYFDKVCAKTKMLNEHFVGIFTHQVPIVNTANIITKVIPGDKFKQPWLPLLFYEVFKIMDQVKWFTSLQKNHPHTKLSEPLHPEDIEERYKFLIVLPEEQADPKLTAHNKKIALGVGAATGGITAAVTGATIGATIGALAIGLPTFGVAAGAGLVIGAGIGAAVGSGAGAGIAAAGVKLQSKNQEKNK